MRIFLIILVTFIFASTTSAQMKTEPSIETQGINSLIGVVTDKPNDFYKIKDLLIQTEGIEVINFCFKDKLLNITFNPMFFKEEPVIFDLITSYYVDAQCFRMKTTRSQYWKDCGEELHKQNIK